MADSFLSGETHYGSNPTEEQFHPDLLMDSGNVVLVTITYRVGPLGYLCLGTESAPGNLSLWDQVIEILKTKKNANALKYADLQTPFFTEFLLDCTFCRLAG